MLRPVLGASKKRAGGSCQEPINHANPHWTLQAGASWGKAEQVANAKSGIQLTAAQGGQPPSLGPHGHPQASIHHAHKRVRWGWMRAVLGPHGHRRGKGHLKPFPYVTAGCIYCVESHQPPHVHVDSGNKRAKRPNLLPRNGGADRARGSLNCLLGDNASQQGMRAPNVGRMRAVRRPCAPVSHAPTGSRSNALLEIF
eukprot:358281-Chlamydomonas_euryale.AAC.12